MHDFKYFTSFISSKIDELKYQKQPRELYEPIEYMLSIGGKRLRPVITLMVCELFGGDYNKAVYPALGMEMFHNFTLVHDDIMDKASSRRGLPTVHTKWDESRAILSGDTMLILANKLMMESDDSILREVMEIYNNSGLLVCDGQQYDMNFERLTLIRIEEYIKMIELKTAVLLASCSRLGAAIAQTNLSNKDLIENFGFNLGISFQIEDDILDVYGEYEKFGKNIGGDILANKKTFLLVKALEIADDSSRKELQTWINSADADPAEKIAAVTAVFNRLGILELARETSHKYYKLSIDYLERIPLAPEDKIPLIKLADYLINRQV